MAVIYFKSFVTVLVHFGLISCTIQIGVLYLREWLEVCCFNQFEINFEQTLEIYIDLNYYNY